MSTFKKGDAARQKMPAPIEGVVSGFAVDQESGALQVCIDFTDAAGELAQVYFMADQIEAAVAAQ